MKSVAALVVVVLAAHAGIDGPIIVVALTGAVAGVAALGYAFHRTENLRRSIDLQRRELNRVRDRVAALEPPLNLG